MGGSTGALAINAAVDEILSELLQCFDVAHIRGKGNLCPAHEGLAGYAQFEYVSTTLPDIFAATDLMLSRAGANAVFEILALGIPALLIPLPREASRGDQILNARYFESKGFSMVLQQSDITPKTLRESIDSLWQMAPRLREAMQNSGISNGTETVLGVIHSTLENKDTKGQPKHG